VLTWYALVPGTSMCEMCSGSEAGSYLRLIDSCITQLKAQGPSRTSNESPEEEEVGCRVQTWYAPRPRTLMCVSTLHPTLYTLHPTPYTLHPTPSTLHPTLYTLHPTPYILHPIKRGWFTWYAPGPGTSMCVAFEIVGMPNRSFCLRFWG